MTHDEARKMVEDLAAKLGEHFDSVQVLVSSVEEGGTRCIRSGVGNFYARLGMAQEFIDQDRARLNAQVFKEE